MDEKKYVWCTYRDWSFDVLKGIQDLEGWTPGVIITTPDCEYDFSDLKDIPILRTNPTEDFKKEGSAFKEVQELAPDAMFHYGWSWFVPKNVRDLCPNVTYHPGRLPLGRGGSPIQNQIRAGWDSTYGNIIELVKGMDEGDIFCKEEFSLDGSVDDVWKRMTETGVKATKRFLKELAEGNITPEPQPEEGSLNWRVTPVQARLHPDEYTGRKLNDIIRAHNESDPNSYVKPAYLVVRPGKAIIATRATLDQPKEKTMLPGNAIEFQSDDMIDLWMESIKDGKAVMRLTGYDGKTVFIEEAHLSDVYPRDMQLVRADRVKDLGFLVDLRNETENAKHSRRGTLDAETVERDYFDNPDKHTYVVQENDVNVGYAIFHDEEDGRMDISVALHPDARGKGKGRELVRVATQFCLERFCPDEILAEIYEENEKSKSAFTKAKPVEYEFLGTREDGDRTVLQYVHRNKTIFRKD